MISRSMSSVFVLVLLSLCCAASRGGTFTISPHVQHAQRRIAHPSPHLTFSLDAHHHSASPSTSFQPLSHSSSSSPHSSRFTTLQHVMATANMSGCAAIDFSASVLISGQGPYRLIVDTGSTTLAVVSDTCTTCDNAQPTYTPADGSITYNGQPVASSYGMGSTGWSGHVYKSSVTVGDSQSVAMAVATIETNNKFIDGSRVCAVNLNPQTQLNTSQGIIGFAYQSLAIPGTDSWITKYVAATGVSNEFTLQMCPTGGNLWVGEYDAAFVGGPFTYIPIVKPNFYAVMLNGISMLTQDSSGNTVSTQSLGYTAAQLGPCAGVSDCAIVDSGTTRLQLPTSIYNVLINYIEADPYYLSVFGHSTTDPLTSGYCANAQYGLPPLSELQQRLPKLSFTFTDANLANPTTLTINSIPGYLNLAYDESGNSFYCSGLQSTAGYAILGFAFMNQFTVRHDLANAQLGFARTAQCGVAAPPLPNFKWSVGEWGVCSVVSCGGGVQWRSVDCTDVFGNKHADLRCATSYTGRRPADSQACNTDTCSSVTAASFSSVTASSSTVQQGQSLTITYSYTGTPDYITLFITPTATSTTTQPSYITRNITAPTSTTSNTASYTYYVPSTLTPGAYHVGAYSMLSFGNNAYTDGGVVTVTGCVGGVCGAGMDVCGGGTCSGRGECDVVDNVAVCQCVSAYNGSTCQTLVGCNTQCVNGGALDVSSCSCICPLGYTGPLCEQLYANMTATLSVSIDSSASANNIAAFQLGFATDIAYAVGLRPNAVVIQSIGSTTDGLSHTLVAFQLTSMGSSDTLLTAVNLLTSLTSKAQTQATPTTLSAGLTTAFLTAVTLVSAPPSTGSTSSDSSVGSRYWPYILGGIGGFIVIFTVLYCANGGRCVGCRRDKVDADLGRLAIGGVGGGSGSVARQGQVVQAARGSDSQKKHHRKPTHEPHYHRSSYFAPGAPTHHKQASQGNSVAVAVV